MKNSKKYGLPRKSKMETKEEYLDKVYQLNKDKINDAYHAYIGTGPAIDDRFISNSFKNLVNEYIEDGYTLNQATKKVLNKDMFTPVRERFQSNVYEAIKGDKDIYKDFRNLTRNKKGQYTTIEVSDFKYEGRGMHEGTEYSMYSYGDIFVYLSQSPKGSQNAPVVVTSEEWF